MVNDSETSQILYDTVKYGGLFIPQEIGSSKFTVESILRIVDTNFKPTYCKERLAQELNIHEQTINSWIKVFAEDLYIQLCDKRKLSFYNLYQIMIALRLVESRTILTRKSCAKEVMLNHLT